MEQTGSKGAHRGGLLACMRLTARVLARDAQIRGYEKQNATLEPFLPLVGRSQNSLRAKELGSR